MVSRGNLSCNGSDEIPKRIHEIRARIHHMADCLLHEVREGVVRLTLNRPGRRNALSRELLSELDGAIEAIGDDRSARVVVLGGNGPVFSSGHDLAEMAGLD